MLFRSHQLFQDLIEFFEAFYGYIAEEQVLSKNMHTLILPLGIGGCAYFNSELLNHLGLERVKAYPWHRREDFLDGQLCYLTEEVDSNTVEDMEKFEHMAEALGLFRKDHPVISESLFKVINPNSYLKTYIELDEIDQTKYKADYKKYLDEVFGGPENVQCTTRIKKNITYLRGVETKATDLSVERRRMSFGPVSRCYIMHDLPPDENGMPDLSPIFSVSMRSDACFMDLCYYYRTIFYLARHTHAKLVSSHPPAWESLEVFKTRYKEYIETPLDEAWERTLQEAQKKKV